MGSDKIEIAALKYYSETSGTSTEGRVRWVEIGILMSVTSSDNLCLYLQAYAVGEMFISRL